MTVMENLEMGAFQRTDRAGMREDIERVFSLFPRLAERRNQKAGTKSGGEQQMCAIGRALMARPKLLLLDEPSMGLAPIFVEKIFEIVVEINQQGTPILLVEQNALMALDVASRGYVLETGKIVLADEANPPRRTSRCARPTSARTRRPTAARAAAAPRPRGRRRRPRGGVVEAERAPREAVALQPAALDREDRGQGGLVHARSIALPR